MTVLILRPYRSLRPCLIVVIVRQVHCGDERPHRLRHRPALYWPQIIAPLLQADQTVPAADKKKLAEATEFFMASQPMTLKAMYDEMAGTVHLTMGRSSFRVSQALRYMGFNLLPDTDYMKFEFEITP